MKRLLIVVEIFLLLGLSFGLALSDELTLTTPITQNSITTIRVDNVSVDNTRGEISYRMSMGYDNAGTWVEVRDRHRKITGAAYNTMMTNVRTSGKTIETLFLERAQLTFPGTIE